MILLNWDNHTTMTVWRGLVFDTDKYFRAKDLTAQAQNVDGLAVALKDSFRGFYDGVPEPINWSQVAKRCWHWHNR